MNPRETRRGAGLNRQRGQKRGEVDGQRSSARSSDRVGEESVGDLLRAPDSRDSANDCSLPQRGRKVVGSRIRATQVAALARAMDERDHAIVATLAMLRVACARQIERVHFTGSSALGNARSCRRVLARLTEQRVIARLDRRIGGRRSGSAGFVYALDVVGQRLATAGGPAGGDRYRRPWTPSPTFLDHMLEVTETFVRLKEAERRGELEVVEFAAEPECWRTFTGPAGRVTLKPDAYTAIARGEYEDSYFLEVDRGTESPRTITRKAGVYVTYWEGGREQAERGVFPNVRWLVPSERRKAVVVDALSRQPAEAWKLFGVRLFEDALP